MFLWYFLFMTRRIELLWNHAVDSENWEEAACLQQLAEGIQVPPNTDGRSVRPSGGCYIYETTAYDENTKTETESFAPFKSEGQGAVEVDVSVLTIPQTLGTTALTLASQTTRRGGWVEFTNFELNRPIKDPDNFSGLVTSSPPYLPFTALTGLISYPNPSEAKRYELADRAEAGISGGVVTQNGRVVGLSYAADSWPDYYDNASLIEKADNVDFPGADYGFSTGFTPDTVALIGEDTIESALKSPKA
jgi:hypothetical protein